MIMDSAKSNDQFGVNYNFKYILLQIRELDNHEDIVARIKLEPSEVDILIEKLQYYKNKLVRWQNSVGEKRENESEAEYGTRIIQTMRENNYFVDK